MEKRQTPARRNEEATCIRKQLPNAVRTTSVFSRSKLFYTYVTNLSRYFQQIIGKKNCKFCPFLASAEGTYGKSGVRRGSRGYPRTGHPATNALKKILHGKSWKKRNGLSCPLERRGAKSGGESNDLFTGCSHGSLGCASPPGFAAPGMTPKGFRFPHDP